MGFIQSLLRQRKLLNSLTRQGKSDFVKPRQSFEQLESRQLYSVTPVSGLAESLGISSLDLVASNSSGQLVAAWADLDTGEYHLSGFKADGTALTGEENATVIPSSVSFVWVTGIAFNNAGQGVIAGIGESGILALQFTISNGELVFAENAVELATESLPANQIINSVDVAMDGSGNFALAWIGTGEMDITPASGADPITQAASSVYTVRYDDAADVFGDVKTVWAASAATGTYSTAGSAVDIAMAPDGKSVIAWGTLKYTFKANPEMEGEYNAILSTYATNVSRYGTNSVIVGAVTLVSSQSMTGFDAVESEQIQITMGGTGSFIVGQSAYFTGVTQTEDGESVNARGVLSFRSYNSSGVALSSLINLTQGTGAVDPYAFGFSANGNIVAIWTASEFDAESESEIAVLHSQTYTNAGAKVGNANTLDLGVNPLTSMVLVTTGETYQLYYSGVDQESGDTVINHRGLQDMKADLVGEIDGGTLPSTLTIGQDTFGALNIAISNIGGFTYTGTAKLTLVLSADDVLGNEDDVTIITSSYALNIAAGAEKIVTISGIKIGKTVLPAEADGSTYTAFVSINATTGDDMDTENNVMSTEVTIAAANSIKDIASDDVIVTTAQTVLVPGDTATATVIVRNTGNTSLTRDDVITVEIYARYTENPDDMGVLIGTKEIRVNLAAGATVKVTIGFKIGSDLAPGAYTFAAVVMMEEDQDAENNTLSVTDPRNVVWEFGNVEGRKGLTKLVLTEDDGSVLTFSLAGSGKGTVTLAESGGYDVTISNTTVRTVVSMSAKGGEDLGCGALHSITAEQDLASITAANFTISGDITLAWIKALSLGDLTGDATHNLTIQSESTLPVTSISIGHAAGLTLSSSQSIGTLIMLDTGEDGSAPIEINAVSIGTLKTAANSRRNSAGHFSGNVTLSGVDDNLAFIALKAVSIAGDLHDSKFTVAGSLRSLAVAGSMANSVVRTTGNISAVSAESMITSSLLAGVSGSVVDIGAWPTGEADFVNHSTIGAVTLRGVKNESHDFVISGFTVGAMKLGRITAGEAGTYGVFVAQADPATPRVKPFGSVSFSYLPAEALRAKAVTWYYKSTFVMPASVEDVSGFVVAAAPDQLP